MGRAPALSYRTGVVPRAGAVGCGRAERGGRLRDYIRRTALNIAIYYWPT